jgi:hypothetical protein
MSVDNRLWGAPHIHGELLKLGFVVAQSTVAKYMAKKGDPSGQSWGTFLRNHAPHIAAMDLFVVPTIGFMQLYVQGEAEHFSVELEAIAAFLRAALIANQNSN